MIDQAMFSAPSPWRSRSPGNEDADRPAGQDQVEEERRERETEPPQIESEEYDRQAG